VLCFFFIVFIAWERWEELVLLLGNPSWELGGLGSSFPDHALGPNWDSGIGTHHMLTAPSGRPIGEQNHCYPTLDNLSVALRWPAGAVFVLIYRMDRAMRSSAAATFIQWFCSPIGLPNGAVSMWWVPIPESQLGPKAWSGKLLPSPPNSQDRFPRRETSSSQRSQAMKRMKKKSTIFIDPPNH